MRMKPLDRVLCITAALFGIGAFNFALRDVGDPRNNYPGWVLPFGIIYLIAGLTADSPRPHSPPGAAIGASPLSGWCRWRRCRGCRAPGCPVLLRRTP